MVPISAIFRNRGEWSVYLDDDGRAVLKNIKLGHINKYVAEVISGLNSGDRVIAHPGNKIKDGIRVSSRKN